MSNRLGSTLGQAYRGTRAFQPPNYEFAKDLQPTFKLWENYSLGDLYLNEIVDSSSGSDVDTSELWYLASKAGDSNSRGSKGLWLMLSGGYGALFKLTGDIGGPAQPTLGNIDILANNLSGKTVLIERTGFSQLDLRVTDANNNTTIGLNSGQSITTAVNTVALGSGSLSSLLSGTGNVGIGAGAGLGFTSGFNNTFLGNTAAVFLSGPASFNTIIGGLAGLNYATTESSNILINSDGVVADQNTLRIGQATGTGSFELDAAYIHGIYQRSVNPTSSPVLVDLNGKLGTTQNSVPFYEEGSFIPTIKFGGAAIGVVYAGQAGTYTKIGNVVNFHLSVVVTNKGSSTGFFTVASLPFQTNPIISPQEGFLFTWQSGITLTAGYESIWGQSDAVTVGELNVNEGGSAVSSNILDDTYFSTSFAFSIHGFYFANV